MKRRCSSRRSRAGCDAGRLRSYDDVIEALASDRADDPLNIGVLPRRTRRRTNTSISIAGDGGATSAKHLSRS